MQSKPKIILIGIWQYDFKINVKKQRNKNIENNFKEEKQGVDICPIKWQHLFSSYTN